MAAVTGQQFLSLLTGLLHRANMDNSAEAYYSFIPVPGQTVFVYNSLLTTGQSYLQIVGGVQMVNGGSGYGISEVPNVAFTSQDAGSGAAGTAVMQTVTDIGASLPQGLLRVYDFDNIGPNILLNGNLVSGVTGYYTTGDIPLPSGGVGYLFHSGSLELFGPALFGINTVRMLPNSGTLNLAKPSNYLWAFDILSGTAVSAIVVELQLEFTSTSGIFSSTSQTSVIGTGTGTIYIGAALPATAANGLKPVFTFLNLQQSHASVGNFRFYTGVSFVSDLIKNNSSEAFQVNGGATGTDFFTFSNGINVLSMGVSSTASDIPATVAEINDNLSTYTISFWSEFVPTRALSRLGNYTIDLVTWPNFKVQIRDGYYGLLCTANNTILATTVQPTSGSFDNIQVWQSPPAATTAVSMWINGTGFSTVIGQTLETSQPWPLSVVGVTQTGYYDNSVDEVYLWNRQLSWQEMAGIASGVFYPFASHPVVPYQFVSGVTITNTGFNYVVPPVVSFDSPTGGGIVASGIALLTPDTGKIYADNLPAFSVGNTENIITSMMSGTGSFVVGNNDFLRVGNQLQFLDWSVFFNLTATGQRPTGVSNVLLSTMDGIYQTSGLIFGINDANRLFFEYIDTTNPLGGQRTVQVLDFELGENNIISISANSNTTTISMCSHNLAKQATFAESFFAPGYIPSNKMFLCGFTNSGNFTPYSGFFGVVRDILLLSGAGNPTQLNALAPLFCLTGYTPASEVPIQTAYPIVTGAQLTSITIGTGITGYGLNNIIIPDKDGSNISAYGLTAQSGPISGTGISYTYGTTSGIYITNSGIPEVLYFDENYLYQFADSNFVMLRYPIGTGDLTEIYSFTVKLIDQISVLPDSFNIYDFYLSDDFSANNANVYQNGLLQVPGVDYVLTSGKIVSTLMAQYLSQYTYLLYDEISGTTATSGFIGYSGQFSVGGNITSSGNNDIYLDGQKLISGLDYTINGTVTTFTGIQFGLPVLWSSGVFAFPPTRTGNRNIFLSSGLGFWNNFSGTLGRLMDEMVYVNGQRLAPNIDYVTVSPHSLINSDFRATPQTFSVYSGEFLDVSLTSVAPILPGVTEAKVPFAAPIPATGWGSP